MIGFVLLPISPAELGKTTNTTFTTSYNASRGQNDATRQTSLLQGKQQDTTASRGHKTVPTLLPFSKQPYFSPLYWAGKGQRKQKNAGENRKTNQKFGSTEQSAYLCTRFSPTNVK